MIKNVSELESLREQHRKLFDEDFVRTQIQPLQVTRAERFVHASIIGILAVAFIILWFIR